MSDDGGPAFPNVEQWNERIEDYANRASEGMTLLDYFAGRAMQALLGNSDAMRAVEKVRDDEDQETVIARTAYRQAKAMLAERAK